MFRTCSICGPPDASCQVETSWFVLSVYVRHYHGGNLLIPMLLPMLLPTMFGASTEP